MLLDRQARTVELVLENGVQHNAGGTGAAAGDYKANRFDSLTLRLDPDSVFPQTRPTKQEPEMTIAELRVRAEQLRQAHDSPHNAIWYLHQKFSIPFACLVFALIGLGLGVSSSRGGKLAAFALGIAVIFAYYVVMFMAKSMVKGGLLPAPLGPWLPNLVLGAFGVAVLAGRRRWGGRSLRLSLPGPLAAAVRRFRRRSGSPASPATRTEVAARNGQVVLVLRVPSLGIPQPGILDMYLSRTYLRLLGLTFVSLLGRLLHLLVHRPVGQAVQGHDHAGQAPPVLLVRDPAVRLLPGADGGAPRGAGHGRPADPQQRADRDAGVRHQPVPRGAAAARVRGRGQRLPVRPRGTTCSRNPTAFQRS